MRLAILLTRRLQYELLRHHIPQELRKVVGGLPR
jgi:hypothetical protein